MLLTQHVTMTNATKSRYHHTLTHTASHQATDQAVLSVHHISSPSRRFPSLSHHRPTLSAPSISTHYQTGQQCVDVILREDNVITCGNVVRTNITAMHEIR